MAAERVVIVLAIVVTVALGTWGFSRLPTHPPQTFWESVYHAVKLYTLDLGPAGSNGSPRPSWQLWTALVLAALLVLRAVIALGRNHLRRLATRYLLRGHVIVCGAGFHGSRLTAALAGEHDVVLVDTDKTAFGMQAPRSRHEWRLIGDCIRPHTLRLAGAARAHWVVAMTGDDFVNSQVVSAMRTLASEGQVLQGALILAQLEDPALARFLETESGAPRHRSDAPIRDDDVALTRRADVVISPFSPIAVAAETLLDDSEVVEPGGRVVPLLRMRGHETARTAPNLLLAGDHPLIDAIILAALRRWRTRVLRELESDSPHNRPPMHISVIGPGAVDRVERLCDRWPVDPHILRLEAHDSAAVYDVALDSGEWLLRPGRADHAIIACSDELQGIGLTLALGRVLGGDIRLTRVTTQLQSVLDEHLEQRTANDDELATTEVKSIAELACKPERMSRTGLRRLTHALAAHDDRDAAGAARQARALYEHRVQLGLRTDRNWRFRSCEQPILSALLEAQAASDSGDPPVPLSALVRAELRVELASAPNLLAAAQVLSRKGPYAFATWCEYVRRASLDSLRGLTHAPDECVHRLLHLKRATLGDHEAIEQLPPGPPVLNEAERITIFAGAAGTMPDETCRQLHDLLARALMSYDGVVLSGGTAEGLPGVVGAVTQALDVRCVGYTTAGRGDRELYSEIHESAGATNLSVGEPLAMWTDIVRAGIAPDHVCLVAFPGHELTLQEIVLARALGARVAWLDPDGTSEPLDELLPTGGHGVLQIPVDAMTVRAFISWSRLPGDLLRERIAEFGHNDHRRKHRGRKPPGDPALDPWDELIPAFKESNLAWADDIPNKLRLIGKRLVENGGSPLKLNHDQVLLLAEAEHGRWNVERLRAGWQLGERHVARATHPDLVPWNELSQAAKQYDIDAVNNIAPALRHVGWGVADASKGIHRPTRLAARPLDPGAG
jgi:voltage-gated potassium channel Kch